jgi:hypothetical protein
VGVWFWRVLTRTSANGNGKTPGIELLRVRVKDLAL